MQALNVFFTNDNASERVIGTYLYPRINIGIPELLDPYVATEIVQTYALKDKIGDCQVLLSRAGGLFVRTPPGMPSFLDNIGSVEAILSDDKLFSKKMSFQERAANIMNRVICEFTLRGVVSEPTSLVHIGVGNLVDNHALIFSSGGGREVYSERTIGAVSELANGSWETRRWFIGEAFTEAHGLTLTKKLLIISDYLPTLVASAYSRYSQGQLHGALADSWIVIEQILNFYWASYITGYSKNRQDRLNDGSVFSAGVRSEALQMLGKLPEELYEALIPARQYRNKLMHGATISKAAADAGLAAMHKLLEFYCEASVNRPQYNPGVNW
ncbi:MAG TPA: hypothetical protein VND68_01150 [Chloroflexia bacterium]|nr:hypothetical protein [Chloroflexia bacterium]